MQPKYVFEKMDASESAFASRQLEQIRAQTYDVKYAELLSRTFMPVDNSLNPGVEMVRYYQYDMVGMAALLQSYAEDLPRADVVVTEMFSKVKGIGSSYGYSVQEIRAAQYANVALDQKKASAARKAIEQRIDAIAKNGHTPTGLLGFLNQPNALTFTVPNGATGVQGWSSKTPDEVLADLHGIWRYIVEQTKDVEHPNQLILPLSAYNEVSTRRMGDGSDKTILEMFLGSSPYVKAVAPWFALETAGAGSTRRMVCYRKDPDAIQLIIPQEFEQFAPQQKGLEIITPCHARIGGVVMYYPLSMAYGDGL